MQSEVNPVSDSNNEQLSSSVTYVDKKRTRFNPILIASLISCVLLLAILILQIPTKPKPLVWEYKTAKFFTEGWERIGKGAGHYASIIISQDKLNEFGRDGWELVSSYLEMETAFPNFGNSSYVTGLQPNVRPQALICIFKRPFINSKK